MDRRISEYVLPVAGTTLSNDVPEGPRAFNVGAEPDLKALMLKQAANVEGSAAIPHVMTGPDKEVYVKHEVESIGEDHEIIEAEEVVFETMDNNLPVIVEGAEETAIVDEIAERDVEMQNQEDHMHLKLTSNIIATKHMQDVSDEVEHMSMEGQTEYSRKMVDKNDPRSRVHFVKYLKRDGKTLKIWECGICAKEFRHQYTLMRHLPTHTDERNFKCETCGKAFRQMSTLSQHRAIHSDARPYVCELCKKTFNRVSTLISHRKTHSGHKPHKCQMCGKGFHQKGNLRNHIFTHTNERPYKCELCGKGFNQMSNLMCHKAHSHGDKSRYICNICHKEFPRRFALRSHEEYKHGIKYRGGERRQELDPDTFREIVSRKQRKKDEKNLRIIHLPNGDRTLADIRELKGGHLPLTPIQRLRLSKMLSGQGFYQENVKNATAGVIIDPINTKAMQTAKQAGQTPFALLKPAKGIPVLVKVMAAPNNKQMLVPATAEDLKSAGKITVSPNFNSNSNGNAVKAVQIKVPVVATVIQKVAPDGQLTIQVEPPGPEQESDLTGMQPLEQSESLPAPPSAVKVEDPEPKVQYVREDGSVIPESELQELSPVNLLAAAVNMVHRDGHEEPAVTSVEVVDQDTAPDLMELASTGEIQFVRATPDGRNYEVLSREEAEQMMQQPGQTIEIVSDEQAMQEETSATPPPPPESEEVNQSSLSAFVDAIRSAGYHVTENQRQIVITEGGEELSPDGAEGEHHIIYGDPEQVMNNLFYDHAE